MRRMLMPIGALCMSLVVGPQAPLAAPASREQGPCEQISAACQRAGFAPGAVGAGSGLLLDCVDPVMQGEAQLERARKPLPRINPQLVAACKTSNPALGQAKGPPSEPVTPPTSGETSRIPPNARAPMEPAADGQTVYDSRLNVTWLADANLAAKQTFGVSGINKNGSMDYATAVRWVQAMNALDHGAGYLGHNNWQLPATPDKDSSCAHTGRHGESFGFHCSGSALGSLYYISFGLREPNTAVQIPNNTVGSFKDFQPYLYWSGSAARDSKQGFVSFSFNTGFQGANVTPNHLYVLPLIKHKLPGTPPAKGEESQANPDGQTVYDPRANLTWLADASLAAKKTSASKASTPTGRWITRRRSLGQGPEQSRQWSWILGSNGLGFA